MAEPVGRARWRIGAAVRVGSVTLRPIERLAVHAGRDGGVDWFWASLEPFGLIVHDGAGPRVVGLDGEPLPPGVLRDRLPGLDDVLAGR